jgi:hypothetical protein
LFIVLTLTRLVVVLKFINFRFALFTPPSRRLSAVLPESLPILSAMPPRLPLSGKVISP